MEQANFPAQRLMPQRKSGYLEQGIWSIRECGQNLRGAQFAAMSAEVSTNAARFTHGAQPRPHDLPHKCCKTQICLDLPARVRPQKSLEFVARSVARFFAAQGLITQRKYRYLSRESVAYENAAVMVLRGLIRWLGGHSLQHAAA